MIKSIKIDKLFGTFDYNVQLPADGEALIITGPNGYGKTTILSIIEALTSVNLLYFLNIPFEKITADYDTCRLEIVSIEQREDTEDDEEITVHNSVDFRFVKDNETLSLNVDSEKVSDALKEYDWIKWQEHTYSSRRRQSSPSVNSISDLDRNKNLLDLVAKKQDKTTFFINISSVAENYKLIPAQRLYQVDDDEIIDTIDLIADNIKKYLKDQYFKFLQTSQAHDSQFIKMLMACDQPISEEEYKRKSEKLNEIIEVSRKYDLSDYVKLPGYVADKSIILKSYIEDVFEKYSVYDKPLDELNLFDSLLTKKKLVNKRIQFSREYGIRFVSADRDHEIPLESLSSGEKNEIIMLYDFIFNLPDRAILMIDEPEISLHVAWQREFMKDIIEIARIKQLRVVIATHSPQIIGGRWKDCYDLFYATRHDK